VKLLLNGEPRDLADVRTVADLPAALGLPAAALLVEHNGHAIRREEWPRRVLAEGDTIELVRIVAGG
jgi:thiamine biosynthesis protein ThiS